MKNRINVTFSNDGPPSKLSRYLKWARRLGLSPEDPETRRRFEETVKEEEKRQQLDLRRFLNFK